MKCLYKIISTLTVIIFIVGCSSDFVDSFSPIPRQELLKHPDGSSVRDCQGGPLPLGGEVEFFWKKNNLPKGTTEFICVDGKAYLSGQEPKAK